MRGGIVSSQRVVQFVAALLFLLTLAIPQLEEPPTAQAVDDPRATTGEWAPAFDWGIFGKHMAMLPNGKVLAWPTGQDAFVWDPQTQTKVAVPANFGDLHCAAQTFLADGRVIVAGGVVISPHDGITVTAIFDPATNEWTNAAPMNFARWYGTSTRLPDGRILVSSGDIAAATSTRALLPEIYDPANNTWTVMPNSASKDLGLYPQMFVLPNGKVYKAGTSANTYSLDTATGTWSNGPSNAFGSSGYAESSAMYAPGKIIRSGGSDPAIANAAIIDMTAATPQWKQISPMGHARRRHNMVILADGEVMAVGGTGSADDLSAAVYEGEIWNPATELWTPTASMTYDRMYHSAALLMPDGRVLTSGGEFNGRYKAQIFSPPYLFKGARPTISAAPSAVGYGAGFNIGVNITDGSTIQGVAMIGLNAVTHAFDHNQRYVPLTFSQSGSTLNVVAPANGNIAPPGYYQLVVKDSKGVPSVAKIIRVDSTANLTPGQIIGTVKDSNGDPISGASVSYVGGSTTTAADGSYTLDNISPGEVLVTFAKSGFATVKKEQAVGGGATVSLDVTLTPPGTITGKITSSDTGAGINGAIVSYEGGTVTTDANGNYSLPGLASGSQIISASATGYNSSADQTVTVPANGTVTANIALTPKPSFVAGEAHDSVSLQVIANASVTIGAYTGTTDATGRYLINMPPGTYSMTVSKPGYKDYVNPSVVVTFGSYTAIDPVLEPVNPALTFLPVADSYTNSALPDSNMGTNTTLRAVTGTGSNPTQNGYLRFNVTGLNGAVQSAKLRMYVTNPSDKAGAIYSVSNNYLGTTTQWTETGLTWNNAPALDGAPIVTGGAASTTGAWIEFDVTSGVTGNGIVNFGLNNTSTNDVRYSTREDANNKPQLVIQQTIPPTITSFTPASGGPGTEVSIIGTGLNGTTSVTFNGVAAASFTPDSATQIHAIVPLGASTGKIGIVSSNGSATSATDFTYVGPAAPAISGFSPAAGSAGTQVTITGSGLGGATAVKFNGATAASFTVDSATQIRAIVPAAASTGKISVTVLNLTATSASNFSVLTSTTAAITGFSPLFGLAGTQVTLTGSGFAGVLGVTFNGVAATSYTVDSPTQIRVIVPVGASTGKIAVTTTSGIQVSTNDYQVTAQAPNRFVYLPMMGKPGSAEASGLRANALYSVSTAGWSGPNAFYCPLY